MNKCPKCKYLYTDYFEDPCNTCVKAGFVNFVEADSGTKRDDRTSQREFAVDDDMAG